MLVLSRKIGEQVVIGSDVSVTVVSVKGNRVTLGINAPRNVPVLRGELHVELTIASESSATPLAALPEVMAETDLAASVAG